MLMKAKEIEKKYKISADTLLNWEKQGKLNPKRTVGGHRRWEEEDILSLLDRNFKFFTPISTSGFTIGVTLAWGNCVKIDIDSYKGDDNASAINNLKLLIYDMDVIDKLIDELKCCRDELRARQDKAFQLS